MSPPVCWLHHVPLASRLLSEACRDPSLWPELRVLHAAFPTEAIWRGFLRWLAARASGLQTFAFGSLQGASESGYPCWEVCSQELMALLAAAAPQLRSLEHWYPAGAPANPFSALPAVLGRLSQLTSLTLGLGSAHVSTAQIDAMVQGLPALRHLSLHCAADIYPEGFSVSLATSCGQLQSLSLRGMLLGGLPSEPGLSALRDLSISDVELRSFPPGVCNLTALTRLVLKYAEIRSLPEGISRLRALRCLQITEIAESVDLPAGVAHLTALTRLVLEGGRMASLPDSISRLTALQRLQINAGSFEAWPPALWRLRGLTRLALRESEMEDLPVGVSQLTALRELDMTGCGLPPGLTACRQLTRLEMDSDEGAPVLGMLQSLRSLSVNIPRESEPYWTQLTGLTELRLRCGGGLSMHPGLGGMTSLRRLTVFSPYAVPPHGSLPAGPYLSSLQSLCLSGCAAVPPHLAAATQLRHLDLGILSSRHGTQLGAAAVAALSPLPALETLNLARPGAMGKAAWDERVAALEAALAAQGRVLSVTTNSMLFT